MLGTSLTDSRTTAQVWPPYVDIHVIVVSRNRRGGRAYFATCGASFVSEPALASKLNNRQLARAGHELAKGLGIGRVARMTGLGTGTVHKARDGCSIAVLTLASVRLTPISCREFCSAPNTSESCHFQTWRGVAKASQSAFMSAPIEPRRKSAGAR